MGRFIVVVIDSFGIGYMDDVEKVRPQDIGANTCKHILEKKLNLNLKTFEKLGLINALGKKINIMDISKEANFGQSKLQHFGGDTFFGHQEIMGSTPKKPLVQPFSKVIDSVYLRLIKEGYEVKYVGETLKYLLVNNVLTIGDNLEADLGQVYNLTANLDKISFDELLKIGKIVREEVKVARVIAFGGEGVTIQEIQDAKEEKLGKYIGINAPKSGVYNKGYEVRHLGYGINEKTQVQTILGKNEIKSIFVGKVADIVENFYGENYEGIVDTNKIFKISLEKIKNTKTGFFCINIQETDLAGHAENVERYVEKLKISDENLEKIIDLLNEDDILLVTADHGNDPTIGHGKHTRENVPILIYRTKIKGKYIGHRDTLSDIGATVAEYFGVEMPENGKSFLELIK
ncbi:phosphopentomutase [Psychrilyobacter atlanticus]|uniref:phosphopentomutase n=1 Tax=Psychrilyobacter atlanticus TaxID=271091 RepID=UPI00041C2B4E|nr:phosphopentomutase [Psychrilyobacter atlanticus]